MVNSAEITGASAEQLKEPLGKGRAKKGIFEGDLENGELEIGQVSALINQIIPVKQIMSDLINEYRSAKQELIAGEKFNF